MRLLIAMLAEIQAESIRNLLYADGVSWDISIVADGLKALEALESETFDLLLIHACLPGLDGIGVVEALRERRPICPPRVLLLCEPEMRAGSYLKPDCTAPLYALPEHICTLLRVLAKKPLPSLAAANQGHVNLAAEAFLDTLSLRRDLKGRSYAIWLLERLVPSPAAEEEPMGELYAACARAHHTTPAAVERCLRVAVESVFTQGSMLGIERFFGATVDPERGKPTNRAFLLQAAQQLRIRLSAYSLADLRSPKSSDMHQSPAAPTIV